MNKCPYCGISLGGKEKFCPNCGRLIPRDDAPAASHPNVADKDADRLIADTYKEEAASAIIHKAPVANMDMSLPPIPPLPPASAQSSVLPPIPDPEPKPSPKKALPTVSASARVSTVGATSVSRCRSISTFSKPLSMAIL